MLKNVRKHPYLVIFILPFLAIDPSGVWMGPPDKREPKVSESTFDQPYQSISAPSGSSMNNQIINSQNNMQKPSENIERTLMTTEYDDDRNLDHARCIKGDISARPDTRMSPVLIRKV